jgi:hypothetical protein
MPNSGYVFDQWAGPNRDDLVDNGDGSWSLMMSSDKEVQATFEQRFEVDVTVVGKGKVVMTPKPPYRRLDLVTVEPQAEPGWGFVGWSGPDAGDLEDNEDGTWSLRITDDKVLTATFVLQNTAYLPLIVHSY